MNKKIAVDFSGQGIDKLIKELDSYEKWLERKTAELTERLAAIGVTQAQIGFAEAMYTGNNDAVVTTEQRGDNAWVVKANGESVLFVEFGSGVTFGYGHPEAGNFGPGTYEPSKGHWDDPNGWWLPKDKGGEHTWGNPPNAPMYNSVKQLEQELQQIVEVVFR